MQYTISQRRSIIILLLIVPFLMGMGIDLYVPSLPAIVDYFKVSSHLVQITIGFYMLGYAVGQVFLGVLSDSVGRRKILLTSGLFYTIVSFLAAFSSNIYVLIFYRLLQGIGIAGLGVVVRAIATDCFVGIDLTKALTCFSMSWAMGPIIGPFIGSYLQQNFNWHTDFYFFGIYGAIILLFTMATVPETKFELLPFDAKGLFEVFRRVLMHPVFMYGSLITALIYAVLVIFNIVGPFLIQNVLHYSVIDYGRIALFLGISYFLGNSCNRLAVQFFQPMKIVFVAIIIAVLISIIMIFLSVVMQLELSIILLPVFLIFFLCGLILPNMAARCVSLFPDIGGTTNAIVGSVMAGGVFVMTAVATAFKTNTQLPMAIIYCGVFIGTLLLFLLCHKLGKQKD